MTAHPSRFAHTPPAAQDFRLLDDTAHQASIDRTMALRSGGGDIWIFGYGSLIWRPEFDYIESRPARVHGYHRALCLWSRVNRGTPEQPGLVFGLDTGGSCQGKVFRIEAAHAEQILIALWRREMPSASYIPRWLNCHTAQGPLQGLVFTMDRRRDGYVPGLPIDEIVPIVRRSHGRYGACSDYVLQTAEALERVGILDRKLRAIARALNTERSHSS